jgi:hypothetical protein
MLLKAKLSPICHLMALLGAHPSLHISKIRVKLLAASDTLVFLFCKALIKMRLITPVNYAFDSPKIKMMRRTANFTQGRY